VARAPRQRAGDQQDRNPEPEAADQQLERGGEGPERIVERAAEAVAGQADELWPGEPSLSSASSTVA
jgi:hypothetical protein